MTQPPHGRPGDDRDRWAWQRQHPGYPEYPDDREEQDPYGSRAEDPGRTHDGGQQRPDQYPTEQFNRPAQWQQPGSSPQQQPQPYPPEPPASGQPHRQWQQYGGSQWPQQSQPAQQPRPPQQGGDAYGQPRGPGGEPPWPGTYQQQNRPPQQPYSPQYHEPARPSGWQGGPAPPPGPGQQYGQYSSSYGRSYPAGQHPSGYAGYAQSQYGYTGGPGAYGAYGGPGSAAGWDTGGRETASSAQTSVYAKLSLITGIVALFPAGFGFGALAWSETGPNGKRGRPMAATGFVLSGTWIVILAVVLLVVKPFSGGEPEKNLAHDGGPSSSPTASGNPSLTDRPSPTGGPTGPIETPTHDPVTPTTNPTTTRAGDPEDTYAFQLKVGECFRGLNMQQDTGMVNVVPCSKPHQGQVFTSFELRDGKYPGKKAIRRQAQTKCTRYARRNVNVADAPPDVQLVYLYPLKRMWGYPLKERTVSCVFYRAEGNLQGRIT